MFLKLLLQWLLLIRKCFFFVKESNIRQEYMQGWYVWWKSLQRTSAARSPTSLDSLDFCDVQKGVPEQYFALEGSCWTSAARLVVFWVFFPSCHCFFVLAKDTLSSFYTWILGFELSLTAFYPFVMKLIWCTASCGRLWQKAVTSKNVAFFPLGRPFEHKILVGDTW